MSDTRFLDELQALIRDRLRDSPAGSYTATLAGKGLLAVAQKVGEEGVELALAGAAQDEQAVVAEAADLLFHLLVLLELREIPLERVIAALEERHRRRRAGQESRGPSAR